MTQNCYNVMVLGVNYTMVWRFHPVCGMPSLNFVTMLLKWAVRSCCYYCCRLRRRCCQLHRIVHFVDWNKMEVWMQGQFEMLADRLKIKKNRIHLVNARNLIGEF